MKGKFGGNRGGGGFSRRPSFSPVKEGQEVDLTIEAVGEKGDGVGKVKGFVLFVPNTKAGDNVRVKITRVLSKVGFAEVIGPATGQPSEGQDNQEQSAQPEPEPQYEDTENFGEETQEENN